MEEKQVLLYDDDEIYLQKPKLSWFYVSISIIEVVIILCTFLVLYFYSEDCEKPLRDWLYGLAVVLGLHTIIVSAFEVLSGRYFESLKIPVAYSLFNTVLHCLIFIWMLIGAAWLSIDTEQCKSDFYQGFMLSFIVLASYFGFFLLVAVGFLLLCCVMCIGRRRISSFMQENEEIN